jgi:hypothetical protein
MSVPKTKKPKKQSIFDEFVGEDEKKTEKTKLENLLTIPKEDKAGNKAYIRVGVPHYMYQVDTLYLPEDTQHAEKYLVVCVDLATNAMDAVPTKDRESQTASNAVSR